MTVPPSIFDTDADLVARVNALADDLAGRGGFVDPNLLTRVRHSIGWNDQDWLERVIGQRWASPRTVDYRTGVFVALAAEADHDHLIERAMRRNRDNRVFAAEAAEKARRDRLAALEAWAVLRARIPVTVQVWHNWYALAHTTGNNWSADHIVVLTDFQAGRLRREKGMALCQTRADDPRFRHVTPNGDDHERVPTCKACVRIAERWLP